ncbi:MAG: hypothetical protein IKE23_02895 [Exiguobacterium sp.]|nr:hypothetical protein [Exiguobacterium sp.]
MRRLTVAAFCILITLQASALKRDRAYLDARRNGATAKMELRISNDDGCPVSTAEVDVFMGMNFREKGYSITGRSDTNGVFIVEGRTCGNEITANISKSGFYRTTKTFRFAEMGRECEVVDGRWQPYGAIERIVLRDMRNPIEMPHEFFWKFKYTKAINTWIGYDIKENDFVAPNGEGKVADFDVYIDWNGEWLPIYTGMSIKIRFTEPFGGYYPCDISGDSEFKGPYKALPDQVGMTNAEFSECIFADGRREMNSFDHSKCWVVRSRCKVSPDGKLISANYSVIYDVAFTCKREGLGGFCITYAFNPTPNDTNLEDIETAKRSRHFIRQCEPPQPPERNR